MSINGSRSSPPHPSLPSGSSNSFDRDTTTPGIISASSYHSNTRIQTTSPNAQAAAAQPTQRLPSQTQSQTDDIANFIYHTGYLHASFADSHLSLQRAANLPSLPSYSLHALLIARSPVLFSLLTHTPGPPYRIVLDVPDPNITTEGLNIALGSLYSGRKELHSADPLGVLAAAHCLGLDELGRIAWDACHKKWTSVEFLADGFKFALSGGQGDLREAAGPYPVYTHNLLQTLVASLIASLPGSSEVLVGLPFSLVKVVLESEDLGMGNMERHSFARDIIARRKKHQSPGVEESVVMAFGGSGSSIEVLRKEKGARKKVLWRAGAR